MVATINKMTIRTTKSHTAPILRRVLLCSMLGLFSRGVAASIDRRRLGLLDTFDGDTLTVTGDDTVDAIVKGSYEQNYISDWLGGRKTVTFTKDSGSFFSDKPVVKISQERGSYTWTLSVGDVPYFTAKDRVIPGLRVRVGPQRSIRRPVSLNSLRPPCRGWTACKDKYGNGTSLQLESDQGCVYTGERCKECLGWSKTENIGKICKESKQHNTKCEKRGMFKFHTCELMDCPNCEGKGMLY
jgi:hypothetical protein